MNQEKIDLSDWFRYFFKLAPSIVSVVLAAFVLVILPQAKEVFIDIAYRDVAFNILFFSSLFVFLWSLIVWTTARHIGMNWISNNFSSIDKESGFAKFVRFFPQFLGFMVIVFFGMGIISSSKGIGFNLILTIGMAIGYIAIVYGRRRFFTSIMTATSLDFHNWDDLPKSTRLIIIVTTVTYGMLFILFIFPIAEIRVSQFIGPIGVLAGGVSFLTFFAAIIQYIDMNSKVPVTFLLLVWILIVGTISNNDGIRKSDDPSSTLKTNNIRDYFDGWYAKHNPNNDSTVIRLIAGQGGGSRAAYWTANVLAHYDSIDNSFYNSIFSFSTVSGSSVGTGFYCAHKALERSNPKLKNSRKRNMREIVGKDFLSPNTGPMFFQELTQVIQPFSVPWSDRSKYLEDAWAQAFEDETGSELLNQHFMDVYDDQYEMPLQFYNSCISERGMQAITGPFLPDTTGLENEIQLSNGYHTNIHLKTAMSLSARFPFFTSPGTIDISKKVDLNFVDGGYFENTGLGTTMVIYDMLHEIRERDSLNFTVEVLYIQNGKGNYFNTTKDNRLLKIATVPVLTLFNTWDTEAAQMYDFVESRLDTPDDFRKIKLDYRDNSYCHQDSIDFPLTRYLSVCTKKAMDKQVDLLR